MEYLSIRQTSDRWGISPRRIQVLCSQDRIPGAVRIGYSWAIPCDAEKPFDRRFEKKKKVVVFGGSFGVGFGGGSTFGGGAGGKF